MLREVSKSHKAMIFYEEKKITMKTRIKSKLGKVCICQLLLPLTSKSTSYPCLMKRNIKERYCIM